MQFAKLFDFPTGQLLVERESVAIGTSGIFSSLIVTTKYQPEGKAAVKAVAKTVYPTTQACEDGFAALNEQQARQLFTAHQDYLRQGREMTFSTDCQTPIERLKSRVVPGENGLERTQEATA